MRPGFPIKFGFSVLLQILDHDWIFFNYSLSSGILTFLEPSSTFVTSVNLCDHSHDLSTLLMNCSILYTSQHELCIL